MGFQMTGFDKLITGLRDIRENTDGAVNEAVRVHTDDVFEETQQRVPKESGRLAATGRIEPRSSTGGTIEYAIWYGEPGEGPWTIDYAAAVHEIIKAKHAPPTGAKYVEQPLIESVPAAKTRIGEAMHKVVSEAF